MSIYWLEGNQQMSYRYGILYYNKGCLASNFIFFVFRCLDLMDTVMKKTSTPPDSVLQLPGAGVVVEWKDPHLAPANIQIQNPGLALLLQVLFFSVYIQRVCSPVWYLINRKYYPKNKESLITNRDPNFFFMTYEHWNRKLLFIVMAIRPPILKLGLPNVIRMFISI